MPDAEDNILIVEWTNGPHKARLVADFEKADFHTEVTRPDESQPHRMSMLQYRWAICMLAYHSSAVAADRQRCCLHCTEIMQPDESQPHRMSMLQYRCCWPLSITSAVLALLMHSLQEAS